jgi:hypothetical protein
VHASDSSTYVIRSLAIAGGAWTLLGHFRDLAPFGRFDSNLGPGDRRRRNDMTLITGL